jgi:hypothetical protein
MSIFQHSFVDSGCDGPLSISFIQGSLNRTIGERDKTIDEHDKKVIILRYYVGWNKVLLFTILTLLIPVLVYSFFLTHTSRDPHLIFQFIVTHVH